MLAAATATRHWSRIAGAPSGFLAPFRPTPSSYESNPFFLATRLPATVGKMSIHALATGRCRASLKWQSRSLDGKEAFPVQLPNGCATLLPRNYADRVPRLLGLRRTNVVRHRSTLACDARIVCQSNAHSYVGDRLAYGRTSNHGSSCSAYVGLGVDSGVWSGLAL